MVHHQTLKTTLLALILIIAGSLGSVSISAPYLESPHTDRTLAFFKASGSDLLTRTVEKNIYIAENQANMVEINISKYTLETVPEQLVQGIRFSSITITDSKSFFFSKASHPKLIEKIFRAFSELQTNRLTISGLQCVEKTKQMDYAGAQTWFASAKESEAFTLLPTLNPNPQLLVVKTSHLELSCLSEASMGWILGRLDARGSELILWIRQIDSDLTLNFLDYFNPKAITHLYIRNAKKLANITCAILKEKKLLKGLVFRETPSDMTASSETLQAIGTHRWEKMWISGDLWCKIATEAQEGVVVDNLTLEIEPATNVLFWNLVLPHKASVKRLHLNQEVCQSSAKTLKNLLEWVDACFMDIEELKVTGFDCHNQQMHPNDQYICIEPHLPKLRQFSYQPYLEHTMHLYSSKSVLWISPDAYHMWASGQLNEEMEAVTHNLLYCVEGSTPTPPFLPPARPNLNPACFECGISLDAIQKMNSPRSRPYVGIVCEGGHMACQPCLKKLARAQKDTNAPLSCPHCHSDISLGQTNGVIERTWTGLARLSLVRIGALGSP
ncbi:hypothetical protein NEDG_01779 [Nematocida displodere]|uniref:RING-type domain-containing protein n=1 Tax=Nematocida displodere TaxID=1805483 RepID=A0A177EIJ3_9MICR|nr:hypothetical protein NEDG_01779 [Nematocida displodere]